MQKKTTNYKSPMQLSKYFLKEFQMFSIYVPFEKKKIVLETKLWNTSHLNSFWIVSKGEHKSLEAARYFISFFWLCLENLQAKDSGTSLSSIISGVLWPGCTRLWYNGQGDNGCLITIYRNSGLGCHGSKWENKRLILKIRLRPNLKETHTENFLSFWWVKTKSWNMIRE